MTMMRIISISCLRNLTWAKRLGGNPLSSLDFYLWLVWDYIWGSYIDLWWWLWWRWFSFCAILTSAKRLVCNQWIRVDQSQKATTSRALEHQAPTSKGHSSLQIKKSTIKEGGTTLSTQANEVFKMVEMWNTYHGFVLKLNDNVLLKIYFN